MTTALYPHFAKTIIWSNHIQVNFLPSTKEKKPTEQVQSLTTATVQYGIHILCKIMFACLYSIVGEQSNFHIVTALVMEKKLLLELNL